MSNKKLDARSWLVEKFHSCLKVHSDEQVITSILVLGGGDDEPEIQNFYGKNHSIWFYGIEEPGSNLEYKFLNLDEPFAATRKFDLVICNQVLEHLYHLDNAFSTIENLVEDRGLLWITVPANNFRHGSPDFYSAGYSKEFLLRNLVKHNFEALEIAELSSKRTYLYRHILKIWPTEFQLRNPVFSYVGIEGSHFKKLMFNLNIFPIRLLLAFSSNNWIINGDYPVETYGLFRKSLSEK